MNLFVKQDLINTNQQEVKLTTENRYEVSKRRIDYRRATVKMNAIIRSTIQVSCGTRNPVRVETWMGILPLFCEIRKELGSSSLEIYDVLYFIV